MKVWRALETVALVALGLFIGWYTPTRILFAAMSIVLLLGIGTAVTLWRLERRLKTQAPMPRRP